jgi:hypothetical protein
VNWRTPRTVGVCLLLVAFLIGTAAVIDRGVKQSRIDHAELLAWYCAHQGTRCGGPSPARIEARWNKRQVGYESAAGVIAVFGVLFIVYAPRLTTWSRRGSSDARAPTGGV